MQSITEQFVRQYFPKRNQKSHKGMYGNVLCIGGNESMGGAIILASGAALYSGAGTVTCATDAVNRTALHARYPEVMWLDWQEICSGDLSRYQVILIGPGMGQSELAIQLLEKVLKTVTPSQCLIIDADGLNLLADHLPLRLACQAKQIILTPHRIEWQRISGIGPEQEAIQVHQRAVQSLNATVVLKGAPTQVYLGEQVWQNTTGNPGQSVGGMGDTLAGMVAGMLAQNSSEPWSILNAVYLHSYIADQLAKNQYICLPSRIIDAIPETMRQFSQYSKGFND